MSNCSFAEWSNLLDQWGASSSSSSSNADHKPEKTIPTTTSVEKLIKEIENPLTREHALFALSRVYIKNAKKFYFSSVICLVGKKMWENGRGSRFSFLIISNQPRGLMDFVM